MSAALRDVTLGTCLDPAEAAQIRDRAEAEDRTVSTVIRRALVLAGYLTDPATERES